MLEIPSIFQELKKEEIEKTMKAAIYKKGLMKKLKVKLKK
jgi:hypothetical protein